MTSEELMAVIRECGVTTEFVLLADNNYELADEDWILNDYSSALRADLKRIGADRYVANRNDCDKFSFSGCALAKWMQNLSSPRDAGLAVGFIGYVLIQGQEFPENHSIMVWVKKVGEKHELLWYDPQTQAPKSMLPDEIASIFFFYM